MNRGNKDQRISSLEKQLEDSERENYVLREEIKNLNITIETKVG